MRNPGPEMVDVVAVMMVSVALVSFRNGEGAGKGENDDMGGEGLAMTEERRMLKGRRREMNRISRCNEKPDTLGIEQDRRNMTDPSHDYESLFEREKKENQIEITASSV